MAKQTKSRFVISLGGSLIAPPSGIDLPFLKKLRQFLRRQVGLGRRFVLVCGGGAVCRQYQSAAAAAARVSSDELDRLGIQITAVNASLVRLILGPLAHSRVVSNPRTDLRTKAPVIVAAGWKPGCSTDKDAVLLARRFGAATVINLSNISFVYDSDPRTNRRAKPIRSMSWADFNRTFGRGWAPGMNSPFDPVAARLAARSGLQAVIANGHDLGNLGRILAGRPFQGTVIG